jgi:hypothetical protein
MKLMRYWYVVILVMLLLLALFLAPLVYMSNTRVFEQVDITADGYELTGFLSEGSSAKGPWVVFGHGNRQEGQNHILYQRLLNNLRSEVTILAIDFRGFGQSSSEGLELSDSIWNRSGDFDAAITHLKRTYQVTDDQIVLIGHSLGAAQALKAAQYIQYRLAIPIGLGDYDVVLANHDTINEYARKLSQNTGVMIGPAVLWNEGEEMRPVSLFTPCPKTPVTLVFGRWDDKNSLLYSKNKVPDNCEPSISWRIIPLADHMYGTERENLPRVVTVYYSVVVTSLLTQTINQLLTATDQ